MIHVNDLYSYRVGWAVGIVSGGLLATILYCALDSRYTEGKRDGMELANDLRKADEELVEKYRKELLEKEIKESYECGRAEGIKICSLNSENGGEQDE